MRKASRIRHPGWFSFPAARWYVARSASASVEVFADLHADVGEAPHWDGRTKTLLFVDLTAGTVFRYDEFGVKVSSFSVGQEVGAAVPRRGVNESRAGIVRNMTTFEKRHWKIVIASKPFERMPTRHTSKV